MNNEEENRLKGLQKSKLQEDKISKGRIGTGKVNQ